MGPVEPDGGACHWCSSSRGAGRVQQHRERDCVDTPYMLWMLQGEAIKRGGQAVDPISRAAGLASGHLMMTRSNQHLSCSTGVQGQFGTGVPQRTTRSARCMSPAVGVLVVGLHWRPGGMA